MFNFLRFQITSSSTRLSPNYPIPLPYNVLFLLVQTQEDLYHKEEDDYVLDSDFVLWPGEYWVIACKTKSFERTRYTEISCKGNPLRFKIASPPIDKSNLLIFNLISLMRQSPILNCYSFKTNLIYFHKDCIKRNPTSKFIFGFKQWVCLMSDSGGMQTISKILLIFFWNIWSAVKITWLAVLFFLNTTFIAFFFIIIWMTLRFHYYLH